MILPFPFDALAEVYVEGSHFDPDYAVHEGRGAFLRRLVREISQSVQPQDEEFEYLATQAVAEYMANKVDPLLDGILFRSTQTVPPLRPAYFAPPCASVLLVCGSCNGAVQTTIHRDVQVAKLRASHRVVVGIGGSFVASISVLCHLFPYPTAGFWLAPSRDSEGTRDTRHESLDPELMYRDA